MSKNKLNIFKKINEVIYVAKVFIKPESKYLKNFFIVYGLKNLFQNNLLNRTNSIKDIYWINKFLYF